MKKLLTLLAILTIISTSCSKEDKAKKLIKAELSKNMNDFKSYEPVEFSKIDSAFTSYEGAEYERMLELPEDQFNEAMKKDSLDRVNFKPVFKGYSMLHSFRAKNSLGAVVLNRYRFYFDKDLDKVTSTVDDIQFEKDNKE
jgi:hypothetical protein